MITISVNPTVTTLAGGANQMAQMSDIVGNAPDPIIGESYTLRTSTSNLVYLLDAVPDAIWFDPTHQLIEARAMRSIQSQPRNEPGTYENNWPFKMAPLPFQMKVFADARLKNNIALTPAAMGTGKTKMALDIAADKFMRNEIDAVCIIAPNGVHRQWIETAIPAHMTESIKVAAAVWKSTRVTGAMIMRPNSTRHLRILAFNVESFSTESGKAFQAAREFLASSAGKSMLVIDESSRIKSPKAARTKAIHKLRPYAKVRANLSGTPITRGLEDLFTQYYALDPNIVGTTNYYSFRNRYCVTAPIFGAAPGAVRIVGYRNVEEFVAKIAPVTYVIPKDVLGLPEKTFERRAVVLTDEQVRIYKALRDELIDDLRSQKIKTPANAAVRIMRLQQVLCGTKVEVEEVGQDGTEEVMVVTSSVPLPSRRLESLYNTLLEHSGPAVIWARFTDDIHDIVSFLEEQGHKVVSYFGETREADRIEAVRKFKTGEAEYFVGNPDAAGTGLDGLQVAELAVYYSNSFRAESRWQSEDRIHRLGMRGRAHYVDLVATLPDGSETVDQLVLVNLKNKGNLAKAVFTNPSLLNMSTDEIEHQGLGEEDVRQLERMEESVARLSAGR